MRKKIFAVGVGAALLFISGCSTPLAHTSATPGEGYTMNPPQMPDGMMGGYSSTASNTAGSGSDTAHQSSTSASGATQQYVYLTVLPGAKLGSDGKKHDAFSPADFTVMRGIPVTITIYNYDNMPHSLTDPSLGLNVQAKPSPQDGKPGVTTATFTPNQIGSSTWRCVDPCDLENGQWAMSHSGYMMGTITVD